MADKPTNEEKSFGSDWTLENYEGESNENPYLIPTPIVLTRWYNIVMIVINVLAVLSVTLLIPFAFGFMVTGNIGTSVREILVTWLVGSFLWINTLITIFGTYFIWSETVIDAIRRIRIMRRK